ncbi:MAG: hypothetical protein WCY67_06800 [Acidithiobacillus sp.]
MNEPQNKLLTLARILLEEDFPEFHSVQELMVSNPEKFLETDYGDLFESEEEIRTTDPKVLSLGATVRLLIRFADAHRYSFWLDWTGEENEGDFELWVAARVHAFGLGSMDLTFVDDWRDQIDWDQIERGDFIRQKFTLLGEHLVSIGLDLIFLSTGEDAYHPFVVRLEDAKRFPPFTDADSDALGWFYIKRWDNPSL